MNGRRESKRGPPTTQANSAAARSSRPGVASRAPGNKGGKNKITSNEGGAPIIVVKLLRTDTTLDLSQKARVVRKTVTRGARLIYPRVDCARTIKVTYTCDYQGPLAPSGTGQARVFMINFRNLIAICHVIFDKIISFGQACLAQW
jgi:hypothetical protein